MGYSMIPMATQAVGANNNTGGIGALNSPWGGSGMDLQRAQGLLDPVGIGGGGGINKGSIEAFLDPAGLDSGPYGLNAFGQRQDPNATQNTAFPNLGASSLIPQMPGGAFQPIHNGTGAFNNMAAIGAGGQTFNPGARPTMPIKPGLPTMGSGGNKPIQPGQTHPGNPLFHGVQPQSFQGNTGLNMQELMKRLPGKYATGGNR